MADNIIDAPIPSKKVRWLYDFLSPFYEFVTRYERVVKDKGFSIAEIKPGFTVLDVAVGTGQTLLESSKSWAKMESSVASICHQRCWRSHVTEFTTLH